MTSPTGNPYVDSLLSDNSLALMRADQYITYYLSDDVVGWTATEENAFWAALASWVRVADITVQQVSSAAAADWIEYSVPNSYISTTPGYITFGMHDTPYSALGNSGGRQEGYFNYETYVYADHETIGFDLDGVAQGASGFRVMVHELGHALGLMHPHQTSEGTNLFPGVSAAGDLGSYNMNQDPFTVMSYNRGWSGQDPWGHDFALAGYLAGPGAFDIAAIQYSVGANMSTGSGNDTYELRDQAGWLSIWDVGGTDQIVYNGSGRAVIDLRSATLEDGPGAGGFLSYVYGDGRYGGYTIAGDFTDALADRGREDGVIIENARGGGGNDRLIGNDVRNLLVGRGGDDVIRGAGGNDVLSGYAGRDILRGGPGDDVLRGGGARDFLFGGRANDRLIGGGGADTFMFRDGADRDVVIGFQDNIDTLRFDDDLWSGHLSVRQVVNQFGHDIGNDIVFRFGDGDVLLLRGVDNLSDLYNDVIIL